MTRATRDTRAGAMALGGQNYLAATGLGLLAAAGSTSAQGTPWQQLQQERCVLTIDPECSGQWQGPWVLERLINAYLPGTTTHYNPRYREIVHATVLPPGLSGAQNAGKVVFFCFPGTFDTPTVSNWQPRTFLWDPQSPGSLTSLFIDSDPDEDVYCSGHVPTRDGNVVVAGGTKFTSPGPGGGSRAIYRLRNTGASGQNPFWERVGTVGGSIHAGTGTPLVHKRYYPGAIEESSGEIYVYGHVERLSIDPPHPAQQEREVLAAEGALVGAVENRAMLGAPDCSTSDPTANLVEYLKAHVLRNRLLMIAEAPTILLGEPLRSWFLPLNESEAAWPTGWPVCSTDETLRMLRGDDLPLQWDQTVLPAWPGYFAGGYAGGNSTQLVYLDQAGTRHEVVYLTGGTFYNVDDAECTGSYDHVEKIVDPAPLIATSAPTWSAPVDPPNLQVPRANHNTVILLDGSLLVVGGVTFVGSGSCGHCDAVPAAELYDPPEVFDSPAASTDDHWRLQASQSHPRVYHSVAGLLPDGRVFSAGGQSFCLQNPEHMYSVEIFSPPYLFWGPRPVITSVPSVPVTYWRHV